MFQVFVKFIFSKLHNHRHFKPFIDNLLKKVSITWQQQRQKQQNKQRLLFSLFILKTKIMCFMIRKVELNYKIAHFWSILLLLTNEVITRSASSTHVQSRRQVHLFHFSFPITAAICITFLTILKPFHKRVTCRAQTFMYKA